MPAIIPHRHCAVCGKAIESDEIFCGKECQQKYDEDRKKQRNYIIFMFAMLFGILFLMMFSNLGG